MVIEAIIVVSGVVGVTGLLLDRDPSRTLWEKLQARRNDNA